MHISSSEDTDLELHYGYENGQTCKQTASCSKGGSVIKNSQCGGAKSVTVKLPDTDTKSNCEVGIHSVDFNCGPASSKPPVPTFTPVYSPPVPSTPQETKPYPIPSVNTTTPAGPTGPTASVTTPETTPISSTYTQTGFVPTPSTTTTTPESSSTPVYSTPVSSIPESTVPVETTPITSATENSPTSPATIPATTVPVYTTEYPHHLDDLPPDNHHIQWSNNICPDYVHNLYHLHYKHVNRLHEMCATPKYCTDNLDYAGGPSHHDPSANNSDSNCYCQDAEFTKTVQDCVSAWAASGDDAQGALSYLAGICAPHVSQNPGIITNVPKTITLVPTPAAPAPTTSVPAPSPASQAPVIPLTNGNSPPVKVTSAPVVTRSPGNSPVGVTYPPAAAAPPVTTLTLSQTVTYACPVSQLADGQPQAPASSSCTSLLSTQVTVPQVGFTTAPASAGASSPSVGLAAGSPAPVLASPTAGPGRNSPVGTTTLGTVIGSASAIGSTQPPGSTGTIPFIGSASNIKVTSFGVLAGLVSLIFLA
ncbi:MAG: hypothetical protein Q9170_000184 [Blastenia crenularia]